MEKNKNGIDIMGIEKLRPFMTMITEFGKILLNDDAKDIGKLDRLHHWQYGFILARLGSFGHYVINNHIENKRRENNNARKNIT